MELSSAAYGKVFLIKEEGSKVKYAGRIHTEGSTVFYQSLSDNCPLADRGGELKRGLGADQHVLCHLPRPEGMPQDQDDLEGFLSGYDLEPETSDIENLEKYPRQAELAEGPILGTGTLFRNEGSIKVRYGNLGEYITTEELGKTDPFTAAKLLQEAEDGNMSPEKVKRELEYN